MKAVREITSRTYYKRIEQTFSPSASIQTFSVPATATSITVDCVASKGADYASGANGANGGRVQCKATVTGGSTLYVVVGGIPTETQTAAYNASDIRTDNTGITDNTSLNSRIIVAGGGGSGGSYATYEAGAGGGLIGANGSSSDYCGNGGSQISGGSGGNNGTFGLGGSGPYSMAGAGGAGWYGGGSGKTKSIHATVSGGGGGGSSYTDSTVCSKVTHTQGYNDGAGYVKITCDYTSTSSDYDFYVDTYKYYGTKETNGGVDTYYALKSLEKGQYGN